jgi:hypothetical protein
MEPPPAPDKAWVHRAVAMFGACVEGAGGGGGGGGSAAGEEEEGSAARLRRALVSLQRLAADPVVTGRWRAPHREAFHALRDGAPSSSSSSSASSSACAAADPSLPVLVRVDASSSGWAAHAVQYVGRGGNPVPVAHFAARFSGAQLAWEVNVREAYALVAAVRLLGRRLLRTCPSWALQTDHRNLAGMAASANPAVRRWFLELRGACASAQAWPGAANVAADYGSRDPGAPLGRAGAVPPLLAGAARVLG